MLLGGAARCAACDSADGSRSTVSSCRCDERLARNPHGAASGTAGTTRPRPCASTSITREGGEDVDDQAGAQAHAVPASAAPEVRGSAGRPGGGHGDGPRRRAHRSRSRGEEAERKTTLGRLEVLSRWGPSTNRYDGRSPLATAEKGPEGARARVRGAFAALTAEQEAQS